MTLPVIRAEWPASPRVRTLITTRVGGCSQPPYDSLNLGTHVGDLPADVAANRARLHPYLPAEPVWLSQVHGTHCLDLDALAAEPRPGPTPEADAALTRRGGAVCAIMTADCLPVLFCDAGGRVVAAAHAGWRGLLDGVLEATVRAMAVAPDDILAWLGPAIGPAAFEVGDDVRAAFVARDASASAAFHPHLAAAGKWWCDIEALARQRLIACGVTRIHGGGLCTASDPARFYSYRRDGVTGRMASLIWLDGCV